MDEHHSDAVLCEPSLGSGPRLLGEYQPLGERGRRQTPVLLGVPLLKTIQTIDGIEPYRVPLTLPSEAWSFQSVAFIEGYGMIDYYGNEQKTHRHFHGKLG